VCLSREKGQLVTYLVAGATGKAGRNVVDHLLRHGQRVRALTTNAAKARFPAGVEIFQGDLTKPETLKTAFDGVVGLHMVTGAGADYAIATGPEIVRMAERAGVRRATLLWNGLRGAVEQAFAGSSIVWTRLEAVSFMGNVLHVAGQIRERGAISEFMPDAQEAMIDEADVGAVAAHILVHGGHDREVCELTGPEALSARQRIAILGEALGREIRVIEFDENEARANWRAHGHSDVLIDKLVAWQLDLASKPSAPSPAVEAILGRPAGSFRQWASANAAAFR
jgi:uncharacterized protein YbjT (DUF2867 family)